ncbi:MAG: energy-coupled thiamine transporter ThiT [Firmicutes bacterium]|nr:energy-coupled thiamine transporter ThiT [Bacillota bacterium]
MRDKNLRIMLETSLLVGAALLLSMLKFWRMPYGGSVSLEMIPIFILAFRRGGKMGILGGALLGFLKLLLSPYIIHPVQLLLDYPVPYAVLGVAGFGILRQRRLLGVAIGSLLRYLTHVASGVIFFAEYAPEGTPALLYSLSYNASYLVVEAILVGITIHLLGKRREIFEPDQG